MVCIIISEWSWILLSNSKVYEVILKVKTPLGMKISEHMILIDSNNEVLSVVMLSLHPTHTTQYKNKKNTIYGINQKQYKNKKNTIYGINQKQYKNKKIPFMV